MSTLISNLIPMAAAVYLLLLMKGVIVLSPEKQIKFDSYMLNKKKRIIVLCFVLIILSMGLTVRAFFM